MIQGVNGMGEGWLARWGAWVGMVWWSVVEAEQSKAKHAGVKSNESSIDWQGPVWRASIITSPDLHTE